MLPALVGFAAKALLPSEKKVDKDKFFEKKKASSIQKIDDEGSVVKQPTIQKKTISTNLLLPPAQIKALPPAAEVKKDVKTGRLDDIFDRVGETLQGIIDVLSNRDQTQKEEETNKKQQAKVDEKKEKEEKLEKEAKKKPFKMPNIKAPEDKFNIMRFFGNVLLGSLALAIFNNLEQIMETLKNVFQTIKDFIKKLGEFFSPVWGGLKWITGEGTKLIGKLLGVPEKNLNSKDIKKNLDEIKNKIPFLKNLFEGINRTIDSLRGGGESAQPQPGGGGYSGPETPLGKGETASANRIYSGLVQRGFTKEEAAAITGNIRAESSFRTGEVNPTSGAFGLMQWLGGRKARLIQFAQQKGKPATDLNVQLDYIVWELKGGNSYETAQFKKAMAYGPDVASKTRGFAYEVERASAAEIEGSLAKRVGAAKSVYGSQLQTSSPQVRQQTSDQRAQQAAEQAAAQTQAPPAPALPSPQQAAVQTQAPPAPTLPSPQQASAAAPSSQPAAPAQAQVAPTQPAPAVSASVPQIMQQAEYEVPGGTPSSTIVPIPIGGGSSPMMMGGGGTRLLPVGVSKQALLNSYYQAQLTGFLYKQG
jgi:SepF-like predicted cell division protein (DUF552 family)